jgi:16S rRNA (uracil1498-N3)-methyltransferase
VISVIIEKDLIEGNLIKIIDKNDINHLKNSFRMKEGELVRAVDGEYEYLCKLIEIEKKELTLEIIEKKQNNNSENILIDAGIAILKNDKMDLVIQKLTEIGVNKIIPLITKRSVVKIYEKKDKWDLIAKEALKQCQGIKFLEIDQPLKLKEIDFKKYDLIVVPYEAAEENTLKNLLKKRGHHSKKILYIIGPEGGFESEEIEYLKEKGCKIVTLGKRILRAETAAIVTGGIIINEFQ